MCDQEGEMPGLIIDEEELSRWHKQKSNGAKRAMAMSQQTSETNNYRCNRKYFLKSPGTSVLLSAPKVPRRIMR